MLEPFNVSRLSTNLWLGVGLGVNGMYLTMAETDKSVRSVLLSTRQQFESLIESLEHGMGPFQGFHKCFTAHEMATEGDKPLWNFSGNFRQVMGEDGIHYDLDWVEAVIHITTYPLDRVDDKLYILHMRRSEAQKLLKILKDFIN